MQISEWNLCCRLFYISKANHGHYSNNMDTAKKLPAFLPETFNVYSKKAGSFL